MHVYVLLLADRVIINPGGWRVTIHSKGIVVSAGELLRSSRMK